MKVVYFRVDSSFLIGTGHVMRCLTLANELRQRGIDSIFICREHPGNLIDHIKKSGFEVRSLTLSKKIFFSSPHDPLDNMRENYQDWLGETWEKDSEQTMSVLGDLRFNCLVIDHYGIDQSWERVFRDKVDKIIVIDDLANRRHDCDILLDQNLGSQDADYSLIVPQETTLLIGPRYALLRPEFAQMRADSCARRVRSYCKNVAISMGGVDRDDETSKMLLGLSLCKFPNDIEVDVLLGRNAINIDSVQMSLSNFRHKVRLHIGTLNMAGILAKSDLLIGAGGTTVWEACCLGLPSILKITADNQHKSVSHLNKLGCALIMDGLTSINIDLPSKVSRVLANGILGRMSSACGAITDGLGAKRVTEAICEVSK